MQKFPDISDYVDLHFYDTVNYYRDAAYPRNKENIGMWMGEPQNVGAYICYNILKDNDKINNCLTIREFTQEEQEV